MTDGFTYPTGYIKREKHGRNNTYQVRGELPLRDPPVGDELVRDLLALIHWQQEVEAHLHTPPVRDQADLSPYRRRFEAVEQTPAPRRGSRSRRPRE